MPSEKPILAKITIYAVISEQDAAVDRLWWGDTGCPLNLLPRLVREAEEYGDATSSCPYCGGDKAEAELVREATADDLERYSWPKTIERGNAPEAQ